MEKDPIKLDEKEVHWRNLPLLTKYLTKFSTIKGHKETGLDKKSQHLITKAIKRARNLNLLPEYGYMYSYYKKPLKTI